MAAHSKEEHQKRIAEGLQARMNSLKLDDGEVARHVGKSRETVRQWRLGNRIIGTDVIPALCELLKTTPNALILEQTNGPPEMIFGPLHLRILRAARNLPERQQEATAVYLESIGRMNR